MKPEPRKKNEIKRFDPHPPNAKHEMISKREPSFYLRRGDRSGYQSLENS